MELSTGQKFSSIQMNKQDKKNSQGLEKGFEILAKIGFPNIVFFLFS